MLPNQWFCIFWLGVFARSVQTIPYRKIRDGTLVKESVHYMVYLTRAEESETLYDAWICGGAIVSTSFIVTSAACVEDVKHMYAIGGYSRYINFEEINTNQCTKASKKKIVFICIPQRYDFAYDPIQKWAFIDIAAVKVESPYDFSAPPLPGCSWTPNKIEVNYDARYQAPNTDAIIMGWGHTETWRKILQPGDTTDYNQEELQYSSIQIMHKPECKRLYHNTPELIPIIDKYMICAMKEGYLNIKGEPTAEVAKPLANGCPPGYRRDDDSCAQPYVSNTENNSNTLPPSVSQYQMQDNEKSDNMYNLPKYQTRSPFENIQEPLVNQYQMQDTTSADNVYNLPKYPTRSPIEDIQINLNPSRHKNEQSSPTDQNLAQTNQTDNQNRQSDPIDNLYDVIMNDYATEHESNTPTAATLALTNPITVQNEPSKQENARNDNSEKATPVQYDENTVTFEDIILNVRRSGSNDSNRLRYTRKAGFCQNDHGGPLVTWVGRHERLLGVASVFRLDKHFRCVGPYLFTSTQCNSAFLNCILAENYDDDDDNGNEKKKMKQSFCDLPPSQKGFDVIERRVSWKYHRDGPAYNELQHD